MQPLVRYSPDYTFDVDPGLVKLGLRAAYHGYAGLREQVYDLREAWEEIETTPLEIIDGGDRVVVAGRLRTYARGSGVELDSALGQALWSERGRVVRESWFLERDPALRAAHIRVTGTGGDRRSGTR